MPENEFIASTCTTIFWKTWRKHNPSVFIPQLRTLEQSPVIHKRQQVFYISAEGVDYI